MTGNPRVANSNWPRNLKIRGMLTKSQSSVAASKAKRKRLARAGTGGSSETTGKPASVSPVGGTEANLEVLQDLKNEISVHGLDAQAQQLL